jgi:hypothetical protein
VRPWRPISAGPMGAHLPGQDLYHYPAERELTEAEPAGGRRLGGTWRTGRWGALFAPDLGRPNGSSSPQGGCHWMGLGRQRRRPSEVFPSPRRLRLAMPGEAGAAHVQVEMLLLLFIVR